MSTETEIHDPEAAATLAAVERFNQAFNSHDVDAIMALMTDDCLFENTGPAPDGRRYEGQAAVRAAWDDLFRGSPDARFDAEEMFATGDRCIVRWRYSFGEGRAGPGVCYTPLQDGHIRGVDVLKVRDGKVAEKLAYVKG